MASRAKKWKVNITPVSSWSPAIERKMDAGLLRAALDVHRLSSQYAPVDKGNLVASGRVAKEGKGYAVIFGGNSGGVNVPYALRRHFENKKNPQTKRYLTRAGDQVSKQTDKYFGDIV